MSPEAPPAGLTISRAGAYKESMRKLLLAAALVASLARAEEGAAPAARIEVAETTFEAGKVDQGTKVQHSFVLRNVGTAELKIDAKPG